LDKSVLKVIAWIFTALLTISMISALPFAQAQYPAVSMWIEPATVELNTAEHTIGYRFDVVVWVNATGYDAAGWQFYMIYNNACLKAVDCVYTGDGMSQWFRDSGVTATVPVSPTLEGYHDETHAYVLHGESWLSGPYATGVGSLSRVTFEVIATPPKGGEIIELLDIKTLCTPPASKTYILDPDGVEILYPENVHNCDYRFTWVEPPRPRLAVVPPEWEGGMYDNVTGWHVPVGVYITGLDAAWYLVNASFKLLYTTRLVGVYDVALNTLDWDVAATYSVVDGTIEFFVETSQVLYGDVNIANITFEILYQGLYPDVDECPLNFTDILLKDHEIIIPTLDPIPGMIRIIGFIALPMPYLEVVPGETVLGPEPSLGEEFTVDIVMKNLYEEWNLVGYDVRVAYDDTLLEVVEVTEGPFLTETTSWGYAVLESVTVPAAAPPLYMGNVSLLLKVVAGRLGTYKFQLFVPADLVVIINGTLTTSFAVTGPTTEWRLIEVRNYQDYPITGDWRIECTPTTWDVELYGTFNVEDPTTIQLLPWFRNVAEPPYSWFFSNVYPDGIFGPHVAIGGMVATDTGEWYIFPEGEGVLATIRFRAIKQIYEAALTCNLTLFDIAMVDKNGKDIPYEQPVHGLYTMLPFELPGRRIDLYTQYPEPYGGQGPNNPSDMFTPQQEVVLYAYVDYNYWPIQNKLVSYEIIDPYNVTWSKMSAYTDENGVAEARFRMPWPCEDPESLFGVWTVIAVADIAEVRVNDTLQFHYDYLVHIVKVSTDKLEYAHGETVTITVDLTSHAMQTHTVVVTVEIRDELGFTVGYASGTVTIGGASFCTPNDYSVTLTVEIPKEAVAGLATVIANCFDKEPMEGGVALCPEATTEIFIQPY